MLNPEKPGIAKTRAYSGAIGHGSLYSKTTITISSRHDICKAFLIFSSYSIILLSYFCEYFMNPFPRKIRFRHQRIIAFLSWSLLCNMAHFNGFPHTAEQGSLQESQIPTLSWKTEADEGIKQTSTGALHSVGFEFHSEANKKRHPKGWPKIETRMRDSNPR